MIQVDGFYLYSTGYSIHPLESISANAQFADWIVPLYVAQNAVETLLENSVFQLQTSRAAGQRLLDTIKNLVAQSERPGPITAYEAYIVRNALSEFEHVLTAEFGIMHLFLVSKKRGYDTLALIYRGDTLFPPELATKVPEAIGDINAATRCIAFELPTAAGFHLHRANESVLHQYYDAVTNGAPRPSGRNIGDYLNALREKEVGDPVVIASLQSLKDLHRNPLIHPEHNLNTVDDALALLGSVHAAIVHMLKAIPEQKLVPQAATSGV